MKNSDRLWANRRGNIAHPNSPTGSVGLGNYRTIGIVGREPLILPHPDSPRARNLIPIDIEWDDDDHLLLAKTSKKRKSSTKKKKKKKLPHLEAKKTKLKQRKPPKTIAQTTQLNSYKSAKLYIQVLEDKRTGDPKLKEKAVTEITVPSCKIPSYNFKNNVITKLNGKFNFSSPIIIQTTYGKGVTAESKSGYGRGTTDADKGSGNTSLGFHESKHREDYIKYLKKHPLPEFEGKVGMTVSEYDRARDKTLKEWNEYWAKDGNGRMKIEADSYENTDEVGIKESTLR